MRIFKTREFNRIVTKEIEISDEALKKAVKEINAGLYDANLGGNVYKKRIALDGRGKSGGARTVLCFKQDEKVFFIDAYAKNEKDNISTQQKEYTKILAEYYLNLNDENIKFLLKENKLFEIKVNNGTFN